MLLHMVYLLFSLNTARIKIKKSARSLTETEQRYSQIKREALAILFGCTKFQFYLLRKHFKIMTDHKPFISMFSNPTAQAPFHIERIRLNYKVFVKLLNIFMTHSISPTEEDLRHTKDLEAYVNYIFQSPVIELAISLDELKDVLNKDRVALKLKKSY